MTLRRKLLFSAMAVAVPAALATGIGAPAAFAGGSVNATGTVACTGVAGSAKFSPPLTTSGGSSETISVKVTLSSCNATGSNVTTSNFKGTGSGKLTTASSSCAGLAGTTAVSGTLPIKWTAKAGKSKVNNTSVTFTSVTGVAAGSNGNAGFTFSHQTSSGSFAGSVSGEVDSNESASALLSACGSKKGVKSLTLVAGHVSQP